MNNRLLLINLSDRQDVSDFHNIATGIPNDINICDGLITYDAKNIHSYDFVSLLKHICIEIVVDDNNNASQAYELIKKFEVA